MKKIKFLLLLTITLISINIVEAITITAVAHIFSQKGEIYQILKNSFNEYAKKENLDIQFDVVVFSNENSTNEVDNYAYTIDSLLAKKSTKYDLYFYFGSSNGDFSPNLLNLDEWLPKEHIAMYDPGILKSNCISDDGHTMGLPISVDVNALFSNTKLLSAYNKEIPKTWDELIETSKYIVEEERKKNNTDLIAYNGLLNPSSRILSLYSFINSYRKTQDSEFPPLKSQETVEALKKLKEVINKTTTKKSLMLENKEVVKLLYSPSNSLFLSFWYLPTSFFKATGIPGWKHGVSGSIAANTNIAVNNNISFERKKAAVEVLKYITLESTQKELIMKNGFFSAINKLYDDPEVCKIAACDLMKGITPFSYFNYDLVEFNNDYNVAKYTQYLFDYLMDDMSLSEAIKKIDDMSKNYYFSIKSNDTSYGLVIFIIFISVSVIMVLSLSMLYFEKTKIKYNFLSNTEWLSVVLGCFIIMCSIISIFDNPTKIICHLRSVCIFMGFIISLTPIFTKLIINIPVYNKLSNWISNNKTIFKIGMIFIGIILNGLDMISSYEIERVGAAAGECFLKCSRNKVFGIFTSYLIIIYLIVIIACSSTLIFMEWNLKDYYYIARLIMASLCMDILYLIFYLFLMKINIDNYIVYNLFYVGNIFGFSLTHFIFLYFVNGILVFIIKEEEDLLNTEFNKKAHEATTSYKTSIISSASESTEANDAIKKNKSFTSIILNCHYKKYGNNESQLSNINNISNTIIQSNINSQPNKNDI